MKRRPCAYLFLSALFGAFFGLFTAINLNLLVLASLAMLALVLIPKDAIRIIALLSFTFFISAATALFHKQKYDETIQQIPSELANFSGVLDNVWPKIDASLSARIIVNGINQKPCPPFILQVSFVDAAAMLNFLPGQKILLRTEVKPLPKALSDAHFDGYHYGLTHDIHAQAQVKDAQLVFLSAGDQVSWIKKLQMHIHKKLRARLTPRESSLLLALMIGDTSLFEKEQKQLFKNLGAQHLLAVSGLQVSLIAFFCFFIFVPFFAFLLPLRLSHHAKLAGAILTLAFIWAFVLLCGCPKSAVRAALMTGFLLSTLGLARDIDILDAFFLSGFFYILSDPLSPLDLGFLLSYAAVFGIIIALRTSNEKRQKLRQKTWVAYWAVSLLTTTIAASLATLPIIASYFFSYAPFSIVANLVLVPVATIFQTPAIILGMVGALFSWDALIMIAAKCALFIEIIAQVLFENIGERLIFFSHSQITVVMATCSLFLLFIAILGRHRWVIIISLVGISAPAMEWALTNHEALVVTLIPVGQGDATLFSMPSGHHMLIDAGGSMQKDFDPGEKYVLPTLRRKGVRKLDVLAITHPDPDHLMGAFAVLENMPVKEIWIGGFMPEHAQANEFLQLAHKKSIPVKTPKDLLGSHLFGQCEVQVLAPNSHNTSTNFPELGTNDNSLVVRILFAKKTLLWPGDIEYFGEQLLLSDNLDITADLLKAPHHGSKTSSSLEFIERVKPSYVFYSTGRDNRFGFPHAEVTTRYQKRDVTAFNTATHGETNIKISKTGISILTYQTAL